MGSGGKGGSQTIGYWYDLDVLATLCHGQVDSNSDFEMVELRVGDRTAWSGSITTSGSFSVYQKGLFGGETREGGVYGQIDVMFGKLDQPVNEWLGTSMRASNITGPVPAYRGEFNLFFRGQMNKNAEFATSGIFVKQSATPPVEGNTIFNTNLIQPRGFRWSAMNPYFKAFKVKMRRFWKGWYPEKARIGNFANPAHIIFECLTNAEWGMGYPAGDMYDARFRASADALYNEGFGLGLVWRQQTSIQEFLMMVLQHINGVINQDRTTGQIFLRLVRNDYVVSSLLELNPTNSRLEGYSRPGFGETVNEVTVRYTTSEGETDAVTVQDLANITSQGQIINLTIDMPGINSATLAARVAQRELESRSKPLCKVTLTTNRIAFNLYEGEVFKFSWPDHGIEQIICRVVSVDLGRLQDNEIKIEAIEDVFGLPSASYVTPQPGGWVDPSNAPAASPLRYMVDTPYYDIARKLTAADLAELDPTDVSVDVFAKQPSNDALDYNLWTASGTATPVQRSTGSHAGMTTLAVALVKEEFSTLQLTDSNAILSELEDENAYIIINGEYMRIDTINETLGTIAVARGVLDTVPITHAIGSNVILANNSAGNDGIKYVPGEVVKVKVQTRTSRGVLDINATPQDTYTTVGRQNKPYPPGKLRFNGVAYPVKINDLLSISFATRNRLTQTAGIIAQDASSITPETGQMNTVLIKGENGTNIVNTTTSATSVSVMYEDEYLSGLVDAAANRVLVAAGLGVEPGAVAAAINWLQMIRVENGWMRFTQTRGEFVDGTTAAQTNRNWATPWTTATAVNGFTLNSSVYQSYISNDPYSGFTAAIATSVPGDGQPVSTLASYDSFNITEIKDHRLTARCSAGITSQNHKLVWWAATRTELRTIERYQYVVHVIPKSGIVTGPLASTRLVVTDIFFGNPAQFLSGAGYYSGYTITSLGRISAGWIGDPTRIAKLANIFGSLMYVPYIGSSTTDTTNGKPINITNVLTGHITYTTAVDDRTAVYQISTDGAVTLLATRTGAAMADQVTSTLGVEIINSTIRTVDIATGAVGSVIATLPSSAKVSRVVGDTTTSTFYVLADNGTIYRYNMSGTLLASIPITVAANADLMTTNSLAVTAGYVYFGFGGFTAGSGNPGRFYRIQKDLSSATTLLLDSFFNLDSGYTMAEYAYAHESSPLLYAGGLLNESLNSAPFGSSATPRLNDELLIELGSVRDGNGSYTKHSITVERAGYGLRYGEYYGG